MNNPVVKKTAIFLIAPPKKTFKILFVAINKIRQTTGPLAPAKMIKKVDRQALAK
jgi:hypothetical protein